MNIKTACWLLLFGVAISAARADDGAFHFSRDIKTPPLTQEELIAVRLDTTIFGSTKENFADLRWLDAQGKAVPYILRKVQTTRARTVRQSWTAKQLSAQPLDDGSLEITVTLGERDPQPTGLKLVSPLRDFKHRVRVSASADGRNWEPAGDEAVIFDYSRFLDFRNDLVTLPQTTRRQFRIVIDDVTAEQESELLTLTRRLSGAQEVDRTERVTVDRRPFRIERIEFLREGQQEQAAGEEKAEYPVKSFAVEQDAKKQQTIVNVVAQGEPLTSFDLVIANRNFSRHAAVEVPAIQGKETVWRQVGSATVSRVDFKDRKREDLSISFPETRQMQYRIVIDNRDNQPLDIAGVKAEGVVYELAALAAPNAKYQLVYFADAEPPQYDVAAIEELLRAGFQPTLAELGPPVEKEFRLAAPEFQWKELVNHPVILGSGIVLMVALLGWGLYRAVKRMDTLPGE